MFGIRLPVFRLDQMLKNYNTRYLPLLGNDNLLALRLVIDNHVQDTFLDKVHLSVRTSRRNITRGLFGVLFPEGRSYLRLIFNTCPRCLEQNEWAYKQELRKVYVKVDQFQQPFQQLSIDPLATSR